MDELTSLARAAGHGDRAALARFIRESQGDVWRLCAYLVDPAAADDLTQDTYLRAIPALRKFRGDAPVEVVLSQSRRVVRTRPGVLIVEHKRGWIMANAGVDHSNVDQSGAGAAGRVLLLPPDPDASAAQLRTVARPNTRPAKPCRL